MITVSTDQGTEDTEVREELVRSVTCALQKRTREKSGLNHELVRLKEISSSATMQTDILWQEFYEAARTACNNVIEMHVGGSLEFGEDDSRFHKYKVLKNIQLSALHKLVANTRNEWLSMKREQRTLQVVGGQSACDFVRMRALPLEVIQHIVSLAYNMEILEERAGIRCDEGKGARGLAREFIYGAPNHRSANRLLLSSTTLQVDVSETRRSLIYLDITIQRTCPLKVRIRLPRSGRMEGEPKDGTLYASRIKSLTMFSSRQLNSSMVMLPHVEEFSIMLLESFGSTPNWATLRSLQQNAERTNLRIATLPFYFLTEFYASGFLRDITRLCIYFKFGNGNLSQPPTLDQCLDHLSHLERLTFLRLADIEESYQEEQRLFSTKSKFYTSIANACRKFGSLRQLQLHAVHWEFAEQMLWRFTAHILESLSFGGCRDIPLLKTDFTNKLSDTFPRLRKLQMPTGCLVELLDRYSNSRLELPGLSSHERPGYYPHDTYYNNKNVEWNFPCLETLDIRGAYHAVKEMSKWAGLLRNRLNSPEVKAINTLYVNPLRQECYEDCKEEDLEEAELVLHELKETLPNVECVDPDDGPSWVPKCERIFNFV